MAVDMADYVPALKREVTPLGADPFASVEDASWVGYLADAFWEARLDGFLKGYEAIELGPGDVEVGPVSGSAEEADQVPREQMALVILYAGIRVLRNQILNTNTAFRAKAGPVEFEQQTSATMLAEMLKQLKATKDRILDGLDDEVGQTGVMILDAFSTRVFNPLSYSGGLELTN